MSTSYTVSQVQGNGDLTAQPVLFDGFSKTVNPVSVRRSIIYTNSSNRGIYDLSYNEYGQYDGIDLTLLVKYLFEHKTIARLAFKDFPVKTIYVLCTDVRCLCNTRSYIVIILFNCTVPLLATQPYERQGGICPDLIGISIPYSIRNII